MISKYQRAFDRIANDADTLVMRRSTNLNECANAVINVFAGSKRIHYSNTPSAKMRVKLGCIQFNTQAVASKMIELQYGVRPNKFILSLERERQKRNENKLARHNRRTDFVRKKYYSAKETNANYGSNIESRLPDNVVSQLRTSKINEICNQHNSRINLEVETRQQSSCKKWADIHTDGTCVTGKCFSLNWTHVIIQCNETQFLQFALW